MRKVVFFLVVGIFSACFLFGQQKLASAAFWSETWLVKINGQEYTAEEFSNWWAHWNDKKTKIVPDSPEEFIDHQLLIQQAVEMEINQNPGYLNKLRVFLKFRSLMSLRNEEISAKIKISDEDVRQYFYENYSPVWFLQILTFKDLAAAEAAYDKMLPFNGQPAGRLAVADLQGVPSAEGGPLAYEEVQVTSRQIVKAKKGAWLEAIRKLEPAGIAKPFVQGKEGGHAIVLRMDSQIHLGDDEIEAKKKKIQGKLFKNRSRQRTNQLIEELMAQYHVVIDEELVAQVDIEKEYEADFLNKVVISMDDLEVTVNDLLINMKQENKVRVGALDQGVIRRYIMGNIVSQTLLDREALRRHYEERPPLEKTWNFYKGNMLRATLLSEIKNRAVVTDEEILTYYNENQEQYFKSGLAEYFLVKGEQALIDKIWKELLADSNKDFVTVAEKYGKAARVSASSVDRLSPEMAEIVRKMSIGEVSSPFPHEGGAALLLLKGKTRGRTLSLAEVGDKITKELNEKKYKVEKDSYLKTIRSRSKIKINNKEWGKLRKKL